MVKLSGVLRQMSRQKVLVAGDLMLDTYTIGKARRISPEAPVAVIHVQREKQRPGGAGNVVLNLIALGAETVVLGRVGANFAGETIRQNLKDAGADTRGILVQQGFYGSIKNRILADNQQIVRVDHEDTITMSEALEQEAIEMIPDLLSEVKVVAISDYGKGFLSNKLLTALIAAANHANIPVIADPKGIDFLKYNGATVLKPNLGEAYAAANLPLQIPLEKVAERLFEFVETKTLMITRSEEGITTFSAAGEREDFPVKIKEVRDVTGAGDTVLATLTYALANQLPLSTAIRLSNVTASMAIERFGCAQISWSELARRLLEEDASNKVFDEEHLFALQAALAGRKFALLMLSSEESMTPACFGAIRQLGQDPERDLVIYLKDDSPQLEFINFLSSLHDVDFILLKSHNLRELCLEVQPEEVCLLEKGQYRQVELHHFI